MPKSALPARKPGHASGQPRRGHPKAPAGQSSPAPAPQTPDAPSPAPAVAAPGDPTTSSSQPATVSTFADLGLPRPLVDALAKDGIRTPFPIQTATLPDALSGRDVLGRGRTGSGKTLAFGLALLTRIAGGRAAPRRPRALVLVPTRELAQQVRDALEPYGRAMHLRLLTVVGGTSMGRQIDTLERGVDVVVATPGRLTDLVERGACRLDAVSVSVLDEADQMADMGFLPAVSALLDLVGAGGQRLLFSATLDRDVDQLVRRYLVDPVTHSVDPAAATITTMSHHVLYVGSDDKQRVTTEIAARDGRTLLFVRTKSSADRLAKQLTRAGVRIAALHGDKTQATRTRTLARFREGALTALVATDVAARGIHVDGIDLVLNVDPPGESKDYLHRSGRTARAGESGAVATLVTNEQRRGVRRMTTKAGIRPEELHVGPGDEGLVRVTGAREPSGVPVEEPEERPANRQRPRGKQPVRQQRRGDPETYGPRPKRGQGNGSRTGPKRRSRPDGNRRG